MADLLVNVLIVLSVASLLIHQSEEQQVDGRPTDIRISPEFNILSSIKRNPFPFVKQQQQSQPRKQSQPQVFLAPGQEVLSNIKQRPRPNRGQSGFNSDKFQSSFISSKGQSLSSFDKGQPSPNFHERQHFSSFIDQQSSAPHRAERPSSFSGQSPQTVFQQHARPDSPSRRPSSFNNFGRNGGFSSFVVPQNLPQRPSAPVSGNVVSPFWADPEGRPAPRPPVINPRDLVDTRARCSFDTTSSPCDSFERYRRLDGSCNNPANPLYGAANTVLQRMFGHRADPTMLRRLSVTRELLPNPRVVSEALRYARPRPTQRNVNLLLMMLGQFIDHDLVLVHVVEDLQNRGKSLVCKECDSWLRNPACAPINIPSNDAFFPNTGRPHCLPFTRSVGLPAVGSSGHQYLEQVNMNSAYLDLSSVYGSDACVGKRLRMYIGGKMQTGHLKDSSYGLPLLTPGDKFPACKTEFKQCYLAGDERSNEHLALLVMHTIFLREHNRLAGELHKLNPSWNDEKLFQEARRLNIALYQHIVYSEFLPVLLGENPLLEQYNLMPSLEPFPSDEYRPRSNAQILHEFAGAAFRVGHSFVPDHFLLSDQHLRPLSSLPLASIFNDPSAIHRPMQGTMYDALLRGLVSKRLEGADLHVVDTLRDKLFAETRRPFSGQDLFSRNIARGRDHGLPHYTALRKPCELQTVHSWEDLSPLIPQEYVAKLRRIYAHWDDVDLFVGGLAEHVVRGGLVGPTFGCIIILQFYILKVSDRFWYSSNRGGLRPSELENVYHYGVLSKLLSRNIDNRNSLLPMKALLLPNVRSNPAIPADQLLHSDLLPWSDPLANRPKACSYIGRDYPSGAVVEVSPCLHCVCRGQGYLHCIDRPRICTLAQFRPEAILDEHCHRLCPEPLSSASLPFPPSLQHHQLPFLPRSANSDAQETQ